MGDVIKLPANPASDISAYTEWTNYTQNITGETTDPTKGTTNVDTAAFKVIGKTLFLKWAFEMTGAGAAGSGHYRFPIPVGFTIDVGKIRQNFGNMVSTAGAAFAEQSGTTKRFGVITVVSNTELKLFIESGEGIAQFISSSFFAISVANTSFSFSAELPLV